MQIEEFKGVYISDKIINMPGLNMKQRLYLAFLDNGYNETETDELMRLGGYCYSTIVHIKKELQSKGLFISNRDKIKTAEDAKEFTIENSHKGLKCEWCGLNCYLLHEHHYPIPKHKGGTEIVRICPNCHSTFHQIFGGVK